MIVLLDTPQDFDMCEKEIGIPVEQLFTPLTRRLPQRPEKQFAIDNGAFSRFRPKSFLALLKREEHRRALCRFVAVPDIFGSARRTLETFQHWAPLLSEWPLAYVCQDGQESLSIPWRRINTLFIGGSTDWKCGPHAEACVKAAKAMGKWVHVGRVNTPGRFAYFDKLGVDSVDGTGISRFTHARESIATVELTIHDDDNAIQPNN